MKKIILLIIPLVLYGLLYADFSWGISTSIKDEMREAGYRLKKSSEEVGHIDLRNPYGDCIRATNTGGVGDYFVPTKTLTGWSAFKQNKPAGVNLDNCISGEWMMTLGANWMTADTDGQYTYFRGYGYTVDSDGNYYIPVGVGGLEGEIKKFSSTGKLLMKLGGQNSSSNWGSIFTGIQKQADNDLSGTGAGYILNWSNTAPEVDEFGNIYVNDYGNNKIKKYSSTGMYLLTIGSLEGDNNLSGTSAQLSHVQSIDYDDGALYVGDQYGTIYKKYSSTGIYLGSIGKNYWDNTNNGTGAKMGHTIQLIPTPKNQNGDILIKNQGIGMGGFDGGSFMGLKRYSSTGSHIITLGGYPREKNILSGTGAGFGRGYQAVSDPYGNKLAIVTLENIGNYSIQLYTSTGMYITSIGDSMTIGDNNLSGTNAQLSNGASYGNIDIQFDPVGNIYIQDQYYPGVPDPEGRNSKIKKYSSTGAWMMTIGNGLISTGNYLSGTGAGFGQIMEYRVDDNQNIYISTKKYGNNNSYAIYELHKYSSTGAWMMTIGSPANYEGHNNLSGTSAVFNGLSTSLDYIDSSGSIYIRDYGTSTYRIKKYSSTGAWMMTLGTGTAGDNNLSTTSAGIKLNGYNNTSIINVDGSGAIYIADQGECYYNAHTCKIKKYSSTGAWMMTLGGTWGDNNSSTTSARFISEGYMIDNSGSIILRQYSTTGGMYKFKKYSSTGAWMMTVGDGIGGDNSLSTISAKFGINPDTNAKGNNYDWGDIKKDILINKDNSIMLIDSANSNIKKYSSTGAWMMTIGSRPQYYNKNSPDIAPRLFNAHYYTPISIYSGTIMVGRGHLISTYSSTGSIIAQIGSINGLGGDTNLSGTGARFGDPGISIGISTQGEYSIFDMSGNIWVADTFNNKIKKYSSTGAWIMTLGSGIQGDTELSGTSAQFGHINTIAPSNNNGIYILDQLTYDVYNYIGIGSEDKVKHYSSTGLFVGSISYSPNDRTNIARIFPDGRFYIEGNDIFGGEGDSTVFSYTSTGYKLPNIGTYELNNLNKKSGRELIFGGIWPSIVKNHIWISSAQGWQNGNLQNDHRIYKFSNTGEYMAEYVGKGSYISMDGYLYMHDAEMDNIQKYNLDGTILYTIDLSDTDLLPKMDYSYAYSGGVIFEFGEISTPGGPYNTQRAYNNSGILIYETTLGYNTECGNTIDKNHQYIWRDNCEGNYIKLSITGSTINILGNGIDGDDNNLSGEMAGVGFGYGRKIMIDNSGSVIIMANYQGNIVKLKKYDNNGEWLFTRDIGIMDIWNASDATFDNENNIFFSYSGSVQKISSDNSNMITFGTGVGSIGPLGASSVGPFDEYGNIYALGSGNTEIRKYSGSGVLLDIIGSGQPGDNDLSGTGAMLNPIDSYGVYLYMDKYGYLYYIDTVGGQIKKYWP